MAANGSPVSRLNPVDRLGRDIDPRVLAAAEEVFSRALEHGIKLLGDPAVVANALEEVAAVVSRVVKANDPPSDSIPIKNLPGYVFRAFVRHLNRLKRKQLVLVASNGDSSPRWVDPSRDFDMKILVDECLAQCDFVTQDMFWRRVQGFSWGEIGKIHGFTGHAAEVRFRHALQRAQARLKDGGRSLPCTTRPAEIELKPAMRTNVEE